ncbi:helix-turn-helix domain-containing protein [Nocardia brasiliensis]|uniref:helix-turn-helix domain-containing protein n=1 Tax=Nocardia brasiliensis TaxID=37326 RepID=UPI0011DE1FB9|nr:helix-turn-helix transcriptional regulator [Nocardia brasiliensis]
MGDTCGKMVVEAPKCVAAQLDQLFERWHETHGRPLTNRALAQALKQRGYAVSVPYLSQLRNGIRTNPSDALLAVLADYFGVQAGDLTAAVVLPHVAAEPDSVLGDGLTNPVMDRLVRLCSTLSMDSIAMLIEVADHLRSAEGLPPEHCTAQW